METLFGFQAMPLLVCYAKTIGIHNDIYKSWMFLNAKSWFPFSSQPVLPISGRKIQVQYRRHLSAERAFLPSYQLPMLAIGEQRDVMVEDPFEKVCSVRRRDAATEEVLGLVFPTPCISRRYKRDLPATVG
jgi:hypothetical protein